MEFSANVERLVQSYQIATTEQRKIEIRDKLVTLYIPVIRNIAVRMSSSPDELLSYGVEALLRCLVRFDATKQVRFTTYALHSIRLDMRKQFRSYNNIVRYPCWYLEWSQKYKRMLHKWKATHGRAPTVAEGAEAMGISEEDYTERVSFLSEVLSDMVFRVDGEDYEAPDDGSGYTQRSGSSPHMMIDGTPCSYRQEFGLDFLNLCCTMEALGWEPSKIAKQFGITRAKAKEMVAYAQQLQANR